MGADGTSTVLSRKMPEREDPPAGEPDDADPAADSRTGTFDREAVVA
jgi:hypothetical protein